MYVHVCVPTAKLEHNTAVQQRDSVYFDMSTFGNPQIIEHTGYSPNSPTVFAIISITTENYKDKYSSTVNTDTHIV